MKKLMTKSVLVVLVALLTWGMAIAGNGPTRYSNLTVADGTTTNAYVPIYGYYMDAAQFSQTIYPAEMLSGLEGETIVALRYYGNTASASWNSLVTISMGITEMADLADGLCTDEMTSVYTGLLTVVDNLMEIEFSTPFTYEGGNLVIAFDNPVGGNYLSCSFYGIESANASRNGYASSYSGTGTLRNFIPKTTFVYGEPPTCPKPAAVTIAEMSAETATITWTEMGGATEWNVVVSEEAMDDPSTGEVVLVSENPFVVEGLEPVTHYYVYVQAICSEDDMSEWTNAIQFTTLCASFSTPFNADFTGTYPPDCWMRLTGLASAAFAGTAPTTYNGGWNQITNGNGIEDPHVKVNIYGTNCKYWLVTPNISIVDGDVLSFDAALTGYNNGNPYTTASITEDDQFMIIISIDGGTTWSQENATVWDAEALGTFTNVASPVTMNLDAYVGSDIRIAFYAESTVSGSDSDYDFHIGNIRVGQAITCVRPSALVISNVTTGEATLSWTENGESTEWNVAISTTDDVATAEIIPVTEMPYTLENLASSTIYYVWVQANCGAGSLSDWSYVASFSTMQIPAELPLVENWEDAATYSAWTFENGTQTNQWFVGNAAASEGEQALYITNDGGATNAYTITATTCAWVYRTVEIAAGAYYVSFDWRGNGETTYDYMRAFLVPATVSLTAGSDHGVTVNGTPAGWISLSEGKLNSQTEWQNFEAEVAVEEGGFYNLVFYWRNDGSRGTQPAGAIDNLYFGTAPCVAPTNLQSMIDFDNEVAILTWDAVLGAVSYNVYFNGMNVTAFVGALMNGTTLTVPFSMFAMMPAEEYCITLATVCADGESEQSESHCISIDPTACLAPTGLTADVEGNVVTLNWMDGAATRGTLLMEGFENGIPANWTIIDADGDGFNWETRNTVVTPHSGSALAASESYSNTTYSPLTPDNYLITPNVAGATSVNYFVQAQDENYAAEHYAVMASTTGTAVADFTILFEETITAKTGSWYERNVELPEGTQYVAFRHFNCSDEFIINIDDVMITGEGGAATYKVYRDDVEIATVLGTTYTDNLLVGGDFCYSVKLVCDNGLSAASNEACVTAEGPAPCEPPVLTAVSSMYNGDYAIELEWTAVAGATGYNLYYGTTSLGQASGTMTGTFITGVSLGGTYCFTVTAVCPAGETDHSNEACATVVEPAAEPSVEITIGTVTPTTIEATMTPNEACASYYYLCSDEAGMAFAPMFGFETIEEAVIAWGIEATGVTNYTWNDMTAGTDYTVFVVPVDADGNTYSAITADVTTPTGGGAGTATQTIALSEITANSVRMIVTPDENTAVFFDGLITAEMFNEVGLEIAVELIVDDEFWPLYATDDWTWQDLQPATTYKAIAIGKNANGEWGTPTIEEFTTLEEAPAECNAPINLAATANGSNVNLTWGMPASGSMATIILETHDVWGDGTGYQILLDPTCTTYAQYATGNLQCGMSYDAWEYTIPTNATAGDQYVIVDGAEAIEVPAGNYDYLVVNPGCSSYGIVYVSSNQCDESRGNSVTFEAGMTYHFLTSMQGSNDCVTITTSATRDAEAFNVYRDGALIAQNVATRNYTDANLEGGNYCYTVKTVCEDGLSDPSNEACATIQGTSTECPAPTGLTATLIDENSAVELSWNAPADRGVMLIEGFETGMPAGWALIDADGDGFNWNIVASGVSPHSGSALITSESYSNTAGALNPDNYLVTPEVVGATSINYFVQAQDASWAAEHYAVMASTTGNNAADFSVVFEETLTGKESGNWYERNVDLPAGTKYVAFRHFNCTDMFRMNLDDVTIYGEGTVNFYNVYRNGELFVENVPATSIVDNSVNPGNYCYTVKTVCEDGLSMASNEACVEVPVPASCPRPTNLNVMPATEGLQLSWNFAGGSPLSWSGPYANNGIGTGAAADFSCAQRFDPEDMIGYDGKSISAIAFAASDDQGAFSVKIWTGVSGSGPATEVYSQDVPNFTVGQETLVELTTPYVIDGNQTLWIGYRCNATGGHPAGVDAGPAVDGKGNMMLFQGSWATLSSLGSGLDYNWAIRAEVEDNTTFNIYRNGTQVASNVPELSYLDNNIDAGDYCYTVEANCGSEVSEMSDEACGTFAGACDPTVVTGVVNGHDVILTWEPIPAALQYKVYYGNTAIGTVTTTTYTVNNAPNGTLCFKVVTICAAGNSQPSEEVCVEVGAVEENESNFNVYPNPANAKVNVKGENIETIAVYNFLGQMVANYKEVVNNEQEINTSAYESGIYMIRITTTNGNVINKRLVIAR